MKKSVKRHVVIPSIKIKKTVLKGLIPSVIRTQAIEHPAIGKSSNATNKASL